VPVVSIDDAPVPSRAERKRAAILQAASDVFLANGYVGASMDDVAARAGVSKQTLYKRFGDKETLFHELVITTVVTADAARGDGPIVLGDDVEADLRVFARHLLHGVMQPHVLQLRRVVIAEATRFPRLGREFHDVGLGKTVARLALTIGELQDRGVVDVADPELAAQHLNWLVLSIPLNRAMLLGNDHGVAAEQLDRYADAGVVAFLRAYAPPVTSG
jgi:TetR/AcrR family transcriptional regulator, mexJK operon transcriptional repressor